MWSKVVLKIPKMYNVMTRYVVVSLPQRGTLKKKKTQTDNYTKNSVGY